MPEQSPHKPKGSDIFHVVHIVCFTDQSRVSLMISFSGIILDKYNKNSNVDVDRAKKIARWSFFLFSTEN